MSLRILHVLDHSLPLHSGYTFRTASILREQRRLGWETFHLTSPKQENCSVDEEHADGWHFYRTQMPAGSASKLPGFGELALMRHLEQRLQQVAEEVRPDILHAHSPVLDGLAALRSSTPAPSASRHVRRSVLVSIAARHLFSVA